MRPRKAPRSSKPPLSATTPATSAASTVGNGRRPAIGRAELSRGNDEPRTQRGRADETNEQPKSGAQNAIRQRALQA